MNGVRKFLRWLRVERAARARRQEVAAAMAIRDGMAAAGVVEAAGRGQVRATRLVLVTVAWPELEGSYGLN